MHYKLNTCLTLVSFVIDRLLEIEAKENKLQAKKLRERKSMVLQQQNETSQLQQARLQDLSTHNAVCLQEETPEKRQERLQNMSEHQAVCLEEETLEKRQERLILK